MSLDGNWLTKSFSRRGTRSDGKYQLGEEGCKILRSLHFHTTSPIIPQALNSRSEAEGSHCALPRSTIVMSRFLRL